MTNTTITGTPKAGRTADNGQRPRILVVADEGFLRDMLHGSLQQRGYDVVSVEDGVEALHIFAVEPFDPVLLDVVMPQLDGFELCVELHKRSDIPIAMLTAQISPDNVVQGFELGADDFITKPFTFKEIHPRIRAILRRIG